MTSPVDEGTPTIDITVDKWLEVPPIRSDDSDSFSGDRRDWSRLHVFQRLKILANRADVDVRDPYWAEIIPAREFIAAAEHYDLERDVAFALRVNRSPYGEFIRDGLFARMIAYLKDFDIVDVPGDDAGRRSLDTAKPIIVGELHCPYVDSTEATFRNASDTQKKIGVDVSAAGVGGGGWSRERLYSSEVKFTVPARRCMLLVAQLRGYYVVWQDRQTGRQMVLTNVTGMHPIVSRDLSSFPDYKVGHICEMNGAFAHLRTVLESPADPEKELLESIQLTGGLGLKNVEHKVLWSNTREYTGQWGFDIDFGTPPLSAGVTYTSQFVKTIEVTHSLAHAYHYIGRFRSAHELPMQWTANPDP